MSVVVFVVVRYLYNKQLKKVLKLADTASMLCPHNYGKSSRLQSILIYYSLVKGLNGVAICYKYTLKNQPCSFNMRFSNG